MQISQKNVDPGPDPGRRLRFGLFVLDRSKGLLLKSGERVPVGKRGMTLLETLASRSGETISKAELLDIGWPGATVEEGNLSVQVALLRKLIGVAADGKEWIETIPRVGYRFRQLTQKDLPGEDAVSLAVLPIASIGNDEEIEIFGDGLTEELGTSLSKIDGLNIIARSSCFAYRGISIDVRKVSMDLGARYVAEGSVRKDGNRVRIAARLVDGSTGSQLWAERYERVLTDSFAVQDDVAARIVAGLLGVLNPSEVSLWPGIPTRGTGDVQAYRCFVRGRILQRSPIRNKAIHDRCGELFSEAIRLDADYAGPYAALAMGETYSYYYGWSEDPGLSLSRAYELVESAISRDPRDAYIHGVAALVAMYARDVERWSYEVNEALGLDRNFAPALALRATLRICRGEPENAIDDLLRAIRLDPHFTHNYVHDLGVAHLIAGHYEDAIAALKERILLVPDTDDSRAYLASALGSLGLVDDAREVWSQVMATNPSFRFQDRISLLPFTRKEDLERIARGLKRAGLPTPSIPLIS